MCKSYFGLTISNSKEINYPTKIQNIFNDSNQINYLL